MTRVDPVAEEREVICGWLHLLYHLTQPSLYIPSRINRGARCKFCPPDALPLSTTESQYNA